MKWAIVIIILGAFATGTFLIYQKLALKEELFAAVHSNNRQAIIKAIKKGASLEVKDTLGQTPLHSAAYRGEPDIIKLLVDKGARLDARDDAEGGTPLHWAAINGKIDNTKILIELGADPNIQDDDGMTPLHWPIARALKINNITKTANVVLLIQHGANPDIRDKRNKTALDYAREKGNAEAVAFLTSL